jgi:superfamily II DNA or RNA helicase
MKIKDNYNFSEWFVKRNLKELGYQSEKMQTVINSLATQELPTVFAACPSAGKTLMSICMIDTILKDNPNFRVLVLAHGTNVLRSQYYEEIVSANPSFTHCEITSKKEMDDCDGQVVVTIPQSIKGVKKLPKFDMVVVDEAHQFYFAEMVQTIIRNVGAKHQLMLTGTPSIFIFNEFPLITVTVNEILEYDMVEDLTVVVASSNYRINREDFNASGEVREEFFDNQEEQTNNTLDDFLGVLESKLKSVLKEFTVIEAGVSALTGWHLPLKALDKTMIVARSQQQGMQIKNYFLRKKVNVALSTSDTDSTSSEIQRFKQDDDCRILIVVGRGILGFSFPRMINVVDMSGTQNIDRIFQLMCRVIRKHPNNRKKFFFKIAPKDFEHNYEYIMTATMCLCDESYYTKYNGENFLDLEIPVVRTPRTPREPGDEDEPREPRQRREAGIRPVEFLGLPEGIRFFKDLLHKDNGEAMVNHSYAKIKEVKYLLGEYDQGKAPDGYRTKEFLMDEAKQFNSVKEWREFSEASYQAAHKTNIIDECTSHMDKLWEKKHTKESLTERALNYTQRSHWKKAEAGAYKAAREMGILDEICSHMVSPQKPNKWWTLERCIEEAKKYKTVKEWNTNSKSSYLAAHKNDWLEECKQYLNNK